VINECVLSRAFKGPDVGTNKSSEAPEPTLLNFGSHTTHQMDMIMWFLYNSKERTLKDVKDIGQVPSMPKHMILWGRCSWSSESLRTDAEHIL